MSMNEQALYKEDSDSHLIKPELDEVLTELQQLREKAARLALLNDLHARLANAVDLPSMIDAFSVWLMPLVPHELMAFDGASSRHQHFCCSCHGPERQHIVTLAERLFADARQVALLKKWKEEEFYVHNWPLDFAGCNGIMLILRQERTLTAAEEDVVNEALAVLCEPLQRAMAYEDVFRQAKCDSLTGLANRRIFDERIDPLIDNAQRHGHPLSMVSMDLDHFKQVNDELGHAAGDEVLRQVAATLTAMIRSSDILVRMGGDEFLLLLPDTDLGSARILAERLCRAVDELDIYTAADRRLGVSIGLSQWQPGMTKEMWLQRVDELLYEAKGKGRNQVYAEGDKS